MEATPSIGDAPNGRNSASTGRSGTPSGGFYVRRLRVAEIECERLGAYPCLLDVLTYEGSLRLPEGIVLGEQAHREFMDQSRLSEDLLATAHRGGEDAGSKALRIRLEEVSQEENCGSMGNPKG